VIGCVIGCSSEAASCEEPALLWCQLLAEMQEYSSQPSQPPGI
jgi:hypothetical protein